MQQSPPGKPVNEQRNHYVMVHGHQMQVPESRGLSVQARRLVDLMKNDTSDISRYSYWHQYLQRKDFTVVVQPFFQNTLVPLNERGDADHTFFSEDCFHFSERGHAEMAIALWNNMESPYLYTLRNSRLLPDQAEASPRVLSWAVPVAAGGGIAVGIGFMMVLRAVRGGWRKIFQ
ncbi:Phospholipase B1, membrane-associated [Pteropus alecto]|uniref:Phospholipase B1, membrane-associated n=1 Tax=Pteropus alecto TaxID=9402 RepID=L5KRK6_PTEAL|nr:Phospholipase B1, membrane-associated [Pteropus alecto]